MLELRDRSDNQSGNHGPEGRVHESPHALDEAGSVVRDGAQELLHRRRKAGKEVVEGLLDRGSNAGKKGRDVGLDAGGSVGLVRDGRVVGELCHVAGGALTRAEVAAEVARAGTDNVAVSRGCHDLAVDRTDCRRAHGRDGARRLVARGGTTDLLGRRRALFDVVILGVVAVSALFDQVVRLLILNLCLLDSRGEQDVVTPGPAHQLPELLEDEQVQDTSGSDFVVVVAGNAVPVQAVESLGEGDDERDGQRVGVAKDAHGNDKVGLSLAKAKSLGHKAGAQPRDKRLGDEDDGNDCKIGELVGVELRGEFGKDQAGREELDVEVGHHLLRLAVEHAPSRDNVARQTDAHDFEHRFKYQQHQVCKVGV